MRGSCPPTARERIEWPARGARVMLCELRQGSAGPRADYAKSAAGSSSLRGRRAADSTAARAAARQAAAVARPDHAPRRARGVALVDPDRAGAGWRDCPTSSSSSACTPRAALVKGGAASCGPDAPRPALVRGARRARSRGAERSSSAASPSACWRASPRIRSRDARRAGELRALPPAEALDRARAELRSARRGRGGRRDHCDGGPGPDRR
jgi:hypothetical protein